MHGKQQRREVFDRLRIEVIFRISGEGKNSNTGASPLEKFLELRICEFLETVVDLESYPREYLRVASQALNAVDSSNCELLATARNSAVAACLHAGVKMRSVPISVTAIVQGSDNSVLLDPLNEEVMTLGGDVNVSSGENGENNGRENSASQSSTNSSALILASIDQQSRICALETMTGYTSPDAIDAAVDLMAPAASVVCNFLRKSLEVHYNEMQLM